jgi:ribosomal protein S7
MGNITASRTQLKPDPKFDPILASKFINCLMWDGKKTIAQSVFYNALDEIKKRVPDQEPIEVFTQAVENVKPHIEVRSKRVGGASYQVPMQVNRWPSAGSCWRFAKKRAAQPICVWLMNSSPRSIAKVLRSLAAKTLTAWRKRTRHSLTSPGKENNPNFKTAWCFQSGFVMRCAEAEIAHERVSP